MRFHVAASFPPIEEEAADESSLEALWFLGVDFDMRKEFKGFWRILAAEI